MKAWLPESILASLSQPMYRPHSGERSAVRSLGMRPSGPAPGRHAGEEARLEAERACRAAVEVVFDGQTKNIGLDGDEGVPQVR